MSDARQSLSRAPGRFFSVDPDGTLFEEGMQTGAPNVGASKDSASERGSSEGGASGSDPSESGPAGARAKEAEYRRRLLRILSARPEKRGEKAVEALLKLGAERLGVENGHLVRIDPAAGTHTIVETSGPPPNIEKGAATDLKGTYCRELMAGREALAVENAPEQGWKGDPAYETYGLATYLGGKVVVEELEGNVDVESQNGEGSRLSRGYRKQRTQALGSSRVSDTRNEIDPRNEINPSPINPTTFPLPLRAFPAGRFAISSPISLLSGA